VFGYQRDDDSGLMLLGHRYYDSSTGRFLSRDPIGDGSNWYSYCRNNPVALSDPAGTVPVFALGLIFALVVATPTHTGQDPGEKSSNIDKGFEYTIWSLLIPVELPVIFILIKAGGTAIKAAIAAKKLQATQSKLQHIYDKHKEVFNLSGNWNKGQGAKLMDALVDHVKNASYVRRGKYRGQEAMFYMDSKNVAVITDSNGNIIAAFKLGFSQLMHLKTSGVVH
jgi:RHS repeat-associated protein